MKKSTMNIRKPALYVAMTLALGACATVVATNPAWAPQWKGVASDTLLKSEMGANVALKPLVAAGNMYGLGPVSGIKGEVALWDSDPVMGMIVDGKPAIVRNADAYATWLIWSQVKTWKTVALPNKPLSYAEINAIVTELASANGIAPEQPLPFLIKGKTNSASVHIVNYQHDGKPMTKEKIVALKTRFSLGSETVDVLGFRSAKHSTNPGDIHMHARTSNAIYHIDDVKLAAGATLYLPER
jgi:hypothetical protein